jgi:glycosyltransferase involved in cell wall biosynthesis
MYITSEVAMRVGIVLNYIRHDSTYAALRTAEILRNEGYSITFFDKSYKSVKASLHDYWDPFVLSSKNTSFDDWVEDCSLVIWYAYPTSKDLKAIKKKNKKSICVATWDSVDGEIASGIKSCDAIVCPSKSQVTYFNDYWRLKNVTYIPLDCSCPLTQHDIGNKDRLRIIVACPGYQIKRIDHGKLFDALYEFMSSVTNVDIDFLYSSKVASQIKVNITKFEKTFDNGNKITAVDDPTGWSEGPLVYCLCDVVLWPVQLESYGYVALEALSMGTPVIAYNFVPMNEIVSDGVNGLLIPCESKETDLGVSYATHNGKDLVRILGKIAASPTNVLNKLKLNVHKGLEERSKQAVEGWRNLVDELTTERK